MNPQQRLLSLDILRGMTVAGMILVNNGYGQSYEPLKHSVWNGMTPCDLVFPFFLFIVGVSIYLSLSKCQFQWSGEVARKILRRTLLLFVIGLAINWLDHAIEGEWACFGHLRVWAVLQRIALSYGIASLLVLVINHRYVPYVIICLLLGYALILLLGNGYAADESNILARVDRALFGSDHLYRKSPVDPEGLLGTISSVAHVLIGFYAGRCIKQASSVSDKVMALFILGTVLIIGGYLLSFGMPLNKRIWSPSYVMVTCGLASSLLALLMVVIDIRGKRKWCTFFQVFGVNPLFLYVSSEVLAIVLGHVGVSEMVYGGISGVISHPQTASLCYALYFVGLNFLIGYLLYRKRIYIKL
jgi:predicted acyltransferase